MPKIKTTLSRWFPVPNDALGGRVQVRHLKRAEIQEGIDAGVATKTIDRGPAAGGQRQLETEIHTNNGKIAQYLAVTCVVAWENFLGADDKPLDCTPENIKLFAREDGFSAFLTGCRETLAKEVAEADEAARKNLLALGSGSPE